MRENYEGLFMELERVLALPDGETLGVYEASYEEERIGFMGHSADLSFQRDAPIDEALQFLDSLSDWEVTSVRMFQEQFELFFDDPDPTESGLPPEEKSN